MLIYSLNSYSIPRLGYILIFFVGMRFVTILIARFRPPAKAEFSGRVIDKDEKDMLKGERTNDLILAGFSLAAFTLFLTLGYSNGTRNMIDINDATFYLSISLACFIIAAYLSLLWSHRYYSFAAETFEVLGILSVVLGILLFFVHNSRDFPNIQTVYGFLFVAIIIILAKGIFRDLRLALTIKSNLNKADELDSQD